MTKHCERSRKSTENQPEVPPPPNSEGSATLGILRLLLKWHLRQSYWKGIIGAVILIFAWRIAHHYFP